MLRLAQESGTVYIGDVDIQKFLNNAFVWFVGCITPQAKIVTFYHTNGVFVYKNIYLVVIKTAK